MKVSGRKPRGFVKKVRIVFAPDFSEGNPYQRLLADQLDALGFDVRFVKRWSIQPQLGFRGNRILHLHWTHPYVDARSRWRRILKTMLFLTQLVVIRMLGVKIVWTVHNASPHDKGLDAREVGICRVLARMSSTILVHCPRAASIIKTAYGLTETESRKLTVIPHGNYIDAYPIEITKAEARVSLGLPAKNTVFLFFGALRPYKGTEELVRAFKSISTPTISLLVAGRPHENEYVTDLAGLIDEDRRVTLVPKFVPPTEVQTYFQAADVVILPFRDVLTSGSLLLAMSFGRAVVVPRMGCTDHYVPHNGAIFLSGPGESHLSGALSQCLETDLLRMGEVNAARALEFSWQEIALQVALVYSQILGESNGQLR